MSKIWTTKPLKPAFRAPGEDEHDAASEAEHAVQGRQERRRKHHHRRDLHADRYVTVLQSLPCAALKAEHSLLRISTRPCTTADRIAAGSTNIMRCTALLTQDTSLQA